RRGSTQDVKQVLDREYLVLDGQVVPVRKSGQKNTAGVVIAPVHVAVLQARENGWASPRIVAAGRGENTPLRGGAEHVLAVRHRVGKQRRVEGIAGGELRCQRVIVGQVSLVVIAHGAQSAVIKLVRHGVRGECETVHLE